MKKDIVYSEMGKTDNKTGALVISVAFLVASYWLQDLILSVSTQILMILIIVFVVHRAKLKTKEVSQWIQPSMYSISPTNIPCIVRWNLFSMSSLFNRYNSEIEKRKKLESKVKNSKMEIKKISNSINDLNNKISKCQAGNSGKNLSLASKTEVNVLFEKISNEIKKKNELEAKCSELEAEIKKKGQVLHQLKEDARVIALKSKKNHSEKYREEARSEEEKKNITELLKTR